MVATILLACGVFTLVRSKGITGDGAAEFAWRWAETAEERLLAKAPDVMPDLIQEPAALPSAPATAKNGADWPGFRGPDRDGIIPGVRIETDWSKSPPVELWRRPIGPGVSSFAVHGDLLYTQEQRGGDEVVACYKLTTGEPVWRHRDRTRFWDSHVGAGPRATPALSDGRVYTFGATGILNALDARDGALTAPFQSARVASRSRTNPADGSSDARWNRPDPADEPFRRDQRRAGRWHACLGARVAGRRHCAAGTDRGRRRPDQHDQRTIEERWTSNRLKPSFSAFVVHEGHAFGFDGRILACMDVEDGKRKWKGGRYGSGQLVLLPDQDLLLVVSEQGELALVAAAANQFTELARFPAIEGKTWNQPVLVGDLLLVRNREEMAAFRLTGIPRRGERGPRLLRSASRARPLSSASGFSVMTAFSSGPVLSIGERYERGRRGTVTGLAAST